MKRFLQILLILLLPVLAFAGDITRDKITARDKIILQGITAPATPSAGNFVLWNDSSDSVNLKTTDDTGAILHLGTAQQNLLAVVDPTINDDSGDGYAPGSLWVNTVLDKVFVCSDATVAAAVWNDLTAAGGGGATAYTGLTDTPASITANQFVVGNGAGTALIFSADPTLLGIEAGATADQTGAEIKTAYQAEPNAFTDTKNTKLTGIATGANLYVHPNHTGDVTSTGDGATVIANNTVSLAKMADMLTASFIGRNTAATGDPEVLSATTARAILGIEAGATADQSNAEIKTAYELNAQTNEFDDAEQSKLAGIEALANVTDATNVAAAGAIMDSDITPAEGFMKKNSAGVYTAIKSNIGATVAPTATDDVTPAGYAIGSIWIDTTADKVYQAADVTDSAAVWIDLSGAGGGSSNWNDTGTTLEPLQDGDGIQIQNSGGLNVHFMHPSSGVRFNEQGSTLLDFRIESGNNTHLFYLDAGTDTVAIGTATTAGANDDDLILDNTSFLHFLNNAGSTSSNYGLTPNASDGLDFHIPVANSGFTFNFGGVKEFEFDTEASGGGLIWSGESTSDHAAPAANEGVLYTKDVGTETHLIYRNTTEVKDLSLGDPSPLIPLVVDNVLSGITSTTLEETLKSYTLPANTMDTDDQVIRISVWGDLSATANDKQLKIKWGGIVVYDSTMLTTSSTGYHVTIDIIRTGASAQNIMGHPSVYGNALSFKEFGVDTESLATTTLIEVTGKSSTASANSLIVRGWRVELIQP